jgi:hypothetical protein
MKVKVDFHRAWPWGRPMNTTLIRRRGSRWVGHRDHGAAWRRVVASIHAAHPDPEDGVGFEKYATVRHRWTVALPHRGEWSPWWR